MLQKSLLLFSTYCKTIYFVMLFISSPCLKAQVDDKSLNIIVAVNNSLILDGDIAFVIEDNINDTIYSHYYLGNVYLSSTEYERLLTAEKCDVVFRLNYSDKHGWPHRNKYVIYNVYNILDSRVIVLAIYDKNRKKGNKDYDCAYISNTKILHRFNIQGPRSLENTKLFNKLVHDFMSDTLFDE